MPFSDEVRARLDPDADQIIARYPRSRSALLPLLHLVQSEEGHVSTLHLGDYKIPSMRDIPPLTTINIETSGPGPFGAKAIGEIPITFREREHGHSKLSRRIVLEALLKVGRWGLRDRLRRRQARLESA